jgi:hypothetical protein
MTPDREFGRGGKRRCFWRNSAAARHRAPLAIEGRSVWLTDCFQSHFSRQVLPTERKALAKFTAQACADFSVNF